LEIRISEVKRFDMRLNLLVYLFTESRISGMIGPFFEGGDYSFWEFGRGE
jgi:hypothetical protein